MNQNLRVNKTNFHMKGLALGLALKQRRKATRKSPFQSSVHDIFQAERKSLRSIQYLKTCASLLANRHPNNQEKNPTNFEFPNTEMCPPCLMIMQSCYCDYRINKTFASSRCAILFTRSSTCTHTNDVGKPCHAGEAKQL